VAARRYCAIVAVSLGLLACNDGGNKVDGLFTIGEWQAISTLSPLPDPLPPDPTNAWSDDPAAAVLGQKLFFDPSPAGPIVEPDDGENGGLGALGDTGKVSCASCHMPDDGWFQDLRSNPPGTSLGVDWSGRNSPPVVNAAYYEWFKWDGGSDRMWVQALGTTEGAKTHDSSRLAVAHNIAARYRAGYDAIFPEPLDPELGVASARFPATGKPGDPGYDAMAEADKEHVTRILVNYAKVIHAYQRRLLSRDAPFDRYVDGELDAISPSAKRGLKLFIGRAGCVGCHNTPLFSDNNFHNVGIPQEGEFVTPADQESGRYQAVQSILGAEFSSDSVWSDDQTTLLLDALSLTDDLRGMFRTKHLRQIAETAPYMHTGQFETLREVIQHYVGGGAPGGFQGEKDGLLAGLNLTSEQVDDLVAFLETLTGEPIPASLREDTSAP
jgi:cytochrome c peroxidase